MKPARQRASPHLGWLLCLASALPGCALLGGAEAPVEKAAAAPAASPDGDGDETPERAEYRLVFEAPSELQALLRNFLDLSRFQAAPQAEGITRAELDRLISAAPAQARALLETEGYFNAEVNISRRNGEAAKGLIALVSPTQPVLPTVVVKVNPGPRTRIEQVTLAFSGPLRDSFDQGDARAKALAAQLTSQWSLPVLDAFRQDAWTSAKSGLIANLRAGGYPAAQWERTAARIDAPSNTAQLDLLAQSVPLFRFGAFKFDGLEQHDEDAVRNLSDFGPGDPYTEKLLLDFQERVQRMGLFEGASVEIDTDPAHADAAEVRVKVKESPLQEATTGVGYSANTGPRLTLEHTHRRVFGQPWVAKNKFELGSERSVWEGNLTSHPLPGKYRNLVGGNAERLKTTDELRTSWSARIGRTQDTERIDRLYYFEYVHVRLESAAEKSNNEALSYNYHWIWRDVDSVLLPTKGSTYNAQGAVGYARSTTQDNGPFVRLYGRGNWYQPLGNAWYATVRGEAGQVFAADNVGLPDTLLFRAGGDESVRGYAYRTLGPLENGVVTSGRVLFTGSAELARPISLKQPAFLWAVFVDAGQAANNWKDLKPVFGYGAGVRWRSPVGPLRLDIAYGHEVEKFRMHLSVGIAF
jgi:translocation and assembly module TamA